MAPGDKSRNQPPLPSTMGALSGENDDTRVQLERLGQRLKEAKNKLNQEIRMRILNPVAAELVSSDILLPDN